MIGIKGTTTGVLLTKAETRITIGSMTSNNDKSERPPQRVQFKRCSDFSSLVGLALNTTAPRGAVMHAATPRRCGGRRGTLQDWA